MELVTEPFKISVQFNVEPYISCLLDVADGMPKSVALRAHDIGEQHVFKVDELDFYRELLKAERHAVKNLLILINISADLKNASKTYIWILEKIYNDETKISDRIQRLLDDRARQNKEKQLQMFIESLDENASANNHTFYNRFSTH